MERTGFEQWKPREVARLLALVETERRYYQEMVAALPIALAVLAPDRAIASANQAFRRLVGLNGDQLRQKNIEQILPSDELIERIRSAHVHGDSGPFHIGIGERRFRIAAIPIRSWEDEMQAETLLMVDPVEAAPIEAVPAHRPAPPVDLSTLPAVVWQADLATYTFTYVSGAVEELSGYPAAHWLAEPRFFSERIHPEDRAEVMALYQRVAANGGEAGGEASAEFRAVNPDGEPVWLRETIHIPAPGAGSRRISGVITAIGERRQLEAQALESGRVEALRGLAGRLAHDLNNPLMIVSGYGEELLNALPGESPMRGDLTQILGATNRMSELTATLLRFTRPQAKTPSMIALSEVMAGLEPRLREIAREIGIAFPAGSVWTFADAEQLGETLAALAAFALECTDQAAKLTLTCFIDHIAERTGTATLPPGSYARLDILAVGHVSEAAQQVFESIFPPKDPARATAPAVALAYQVVRQWGGDIWFASRPKQGSSFTVWLPYAEAPYAEPAPEPEFAPAEALPVQPGSMKRAPVEPPPVEAAPEPEPSLGTILVVEDEPGIRGLVRKILRREHYEVLEAGSGEEALRIASAHAATQLGPLDLLLTDVILPGMGGRELAEWLTTASPTTKVVYVSGFTDDEGVRAGQFPPGASFLQKPFTLSALVGVVKEALGR